MIVSASKSPVFNPPKWFRFSVILTILVPLTSFAQTFYDGVRGPGLLQLDTVFHSTEQNNAYSLTPKVFTKYLLLAAPTSLLSGEIKSQGVNLGYISESRERKVNGIAALGFFKSSDGDFSTVNPQLYLTAEVGRLTFDAQASAALEDGFSQTGATFAVISGYQILDRVRAGGALLKNESENLKGRLIARFEVDASKHRCWFEAYFDEHSIGARIVLNDLMPSEESADQSRRP